MLLDQADIHPDSTMMTHRVGEQVRIVLAVVACCKSLIVDLPMAMKTVIMRAVLALRKRSWISSDGVARPEPKGSRTTAAAKTFPRRGDLVRGRGEDTRYLSSRTNDMWRSNEKCLFCCIRTAFVSLAFGIASVLHRFAHFFDEIELGCPDMRRGKE